MPENDTGTPAEPQDSSSVYTPPATQADLDRIIAERVARTKAQYKDYSELKAKAARADELEALTQTETEKAVKAARDEVEQRVRGEVLTERVLDRVEVLAAKDFADPEDARLRLASKAAEFVKDGKPDSDAIKAELAELLKAKPHLAAQGDGRPRGDIQQGPRQTATAPLNGNQLLRDLASR